MTKHLIQFIVINFVGASMCCLSGGCALTPKAIQAEKYFVSEELRSDMPEIERGQRRSVIDGIGWVVGIPSKILLWNRRMENHNISPETEAKLTAYAEANGLDTVKFRLNQYAPIRDFHRLVDNKSVGAPWRYTFGLVSVAGEAILPGRIVGGDHYNPFTNTVHLYSDVGAVALHEAAHAKDFARRKWKGTYAVGYLLPFTPLYYESVASRDVLAYTQALGTFDEQCEALNVMYPAYGTYVGSAGSSIFPDYSNPIYFGSVLTGHAIGRFKSHRLRKTEANVEQSIESTQDL